MSIYINKIRTEVVYRIENHKFGFYRILFENDVTNPKKNDFILQELIFRFQYKSNVFYEKWKVIERTTNLKLIEKRMGTGINRVHLTKFGEQNEAITNYLRWKIKKICANEWVLD